MLRISRTEVIFYMFPPSKKEGEVDQRSLRGGGGGRYTKLSVLSVQLHLLRLASNSWSSEAEKTKSLNIAGHGRWRQDLSLLQEVGRGKELAWGNQSNHFQNWLGRHTSSHAAQSAQKVRPRASHAPKPSTSQSWQCIHSLHQTLYWCEVYLDL